MSSRWGEDVDEELQSKRMRRKAHFNLNFRTLILTATAIEEETREWNNQYPKSEFLKIWSIALFVYFVSAIFSYQVFWVITGLMFIFYGMVFFSVGKVWKRFYPVWKYWLMTVISVAIVIVLGFIIQFYIFGR